MEETTEPRTFVRADPSEPGASVGRKDQRTSDLGGVFSAKAGYVFNVQAQDGRYPDQQQAEGLPAL